MNFFERTIEIISPRWARRRATDRAVLNLTRKYEAASKADRMSGWRALSTSANSEISSSLVTVRNRSRQLIRDNPYANRALQVISNGVVGYGIMTEFSASRANAAWKEWAESKDCDYEGLCNIYGLQEKSIKCVVESGEVLIRRRWVRDGKIKLKLQLLEPDYIDTSKDMWGEQGKRIIQGVQFDLNGKKEGYWMFKTHPGDLMLSYAQSLESEFVPASEIIHVMRHDRIGQVRGMPWGASAMVRLHDLDAFEDAQLLRQKIAACFAAFVHDSDPDDATTAGKYEMTEKIDPATIQFLPPGKTVSFANPPSLAGYTDYTSQILHAIAVGYGVTHESLTGDYSKVNFTSGRMGRIDYFGNLDGWQWNMFIPQFCDGVAAWFKEALILAGIGVDGLKHKHTPPKRSMTDPTREVPMIIQSIRAGLTSLPAALREAGENPDSVLAEIQDSNNKLDKAGIKLDSDPRAMTQQGQYQMNISDNGGSNA